MRTKYLRKLGIIEGKLPNIYISAKVAETLDQKEQYVKNKGFEEEAYKKWIINYLENFEKGKKKDFIQLLKDKLPDNLDEKQKVARVKYLLQKMQKEGTITTDSKNRRLANWILVK